MQRKFSLILVSILIFSITPLTSSQVVEENNFVTVLNSSFNNFNSNNDNIVDSDTSDKSLIDLVNEFVDIMNIGKDNISKDELIRAIEILLNILSINNYDFSLLISDLEKAQKEILELKSNNTIQEEIISNMTNEIEELQLHILQLEKSNATLQQNNEELKNKIYKMPSSVLFQTQYYFNSNLNIGLGYNLGLNNFSIGLNANILLNLNSITNSTFGLGLTFLIKL